jgi:hypothetical protein
MDPADRDDLLTFVQRFPEFFLIFRPFHLRTDKEKIENDYDKDQRKKRIPGARAVS